MNTLDKRAWIMVGILFVAIVLSTWLLRVDIPYEVDPALNMTAGYVTLGGTLIFVSAMLLGGPLAAIICAVGCALADVIAGHAGYAIASFVINGVMAYAAYFLLKRSNTFMQRVKALVISGVWSIVAYFVFDFVIRGNYYIAAIALPFRILQLLASVTIAGLVLFLSGWKPYQQGGNASVFTSETSARNLK